MKLKVLKTIKLGCPGGLKTYQPGEFVDPFNNSKLYTEMGFVVPVVGNIVESVKTSRPAPTTPIAQRKAPKPEPAAPAEEVEDLDTVSPGDVHFTRDDLESLYKKDLKELAKEYNIDPAQSKAELIDAIEAAQK